MAISKKILDLAHLDLSDRVLTFTDRQTIVKAAMEEGTPEVEINAVLDNMLTQRLKSFTKEELRSCPHCGAQIPLISDTCLFCGGSLQSTNTKPNIPTPKITGTEAEIIQRENLDTAAYHRNLKQCPDCGAPYPLVSNICTQCGHVLHEQTDSVLNVKNLITNIQQSIDELKKTPQPTFWQVLWYRKNIYTFLVALLLLALSIYF
ncbi:MAG: zinc ribbon domain-containing protein, partial [Bacteroidales bacterium]|nr:zinc ribbon domain-containing protein [Bacteroidales bacterium]